MQAALEEDNDRLTDELQAKVTALRFASQSIHDEVSEHNRMLSGMVRARAGARVARPPARRRLPLRAPAASRPPSSPPFPLRSQSTDFDRTGSLLSGTLQRLDGLLRQGRQGHMCYMIAFALTVFLLLWFVMSKR